jgi:hypothetical protein
MTSWRKNALVFYLHRGLTICKGQFCEESLFLSREGNIDKVAVKSLLAHKLAHLCTLLSCWTCYKLWASLIVIVLLIRACNYKAWNEFVLISVKYVEIVFSLESYHRWNNRLDLIGLECQFDLFYANIIFNWFRYFLVIHLLL